MATSPMTPQPGGAWSAGSNTQLGAAFADDDGTPAAAQAFASTAWVAAHLCAMAGCAAPAIALLGISPDRPPAAP